VGSYRVQMNKPKTPGKNKLPSYKADVIGASAGGIDALGKILPQLPKAYPLPIVIVLHVPADRPSFLSELFRAKTELQVKEAEEKETALPGTVYFAPPGYHLLLERDLTFSLSTEDPLNYARPAIDILFETASDALGSRLVGVLLTGANHDGAAGLKKIHEAGGLVLVQDPATAQSRTMPAAGCAAIAANEKQILSLDGIARKLLDLNTLEPCALSGIITI